MKKLLLPLLSALLAADAPGEAVRIDYHPAAGTLVKRRIVSELELDLEELRVRMNGAEVPPEYLPPLDVTVHAALDLAVEDRIEAVEGGRPMRFVRTFSGIEQTVDVTVSMPPAPEEVQERTGSSPLVGHELLFQWENGAGEYEVTPVAAEEAGLPLDGLVEDVDMRSLLPAEEVEVGASWTVDAGFLRHLESPGGDLGIVYEGDLEDEQTFGPDDPWEGEATVVFTGWDESAGERVAVLTLKGEATRRGSRATDLSDVPVAEGTATEEAEASYAFDGTLRWDVDRGLLHDFALEVDVESLFTTVKDPGQPGPDYEQEMPMTGTWTVSIGRTE